MRPHPRDDLSDIRVSRGSMEEDRIESTIFISADLGCRMPLGTSVYDAYVHHDSVEEFEIPGPRVRTVPSAHQQACLTFVTAFQPASYCTHLNETVETVLETSAALVIHQCGSVTVLAGRRETALRKPRHK